MSCSTSTNSFAIINLALHIPTTPATILPVKLIVNQPRALEQAQPPVGVQELGLGDHFAVGAERVDGLEAAFVGSQCLRALVLGNICGYEDGESRIQLINEK